MTAPAQAAAVALEALVQAKTAQMLALDQELQALRALRADDITEASPDVALALYTALSGAPALVALADGLGWRLPGVKGPRRWQREDVYELVTSTDTPANPVLRAMAQQRLQNKQFGRRIGPAAYG